MQLITRFYISGFNMEKRKQRRDKWICTGFLLVLLAFWAADLMSADRIYSDWEKRMLAGKPDFSAESVMDGSYEKAYENWLTDQFPERDLWIGWKTRCEILLGKKEINGIYLGKDGYLFAESEATMNWDKLESQLVSRFGQECVSRIHAPAAGTVLEEKLPEGISFPAAEDAVCRNLKKHRAEYIYFRTDHHWTMLGAFYAYEAWAKERGMTPVLVQDMKRSVLKEDFLGTHYGRLHYAKQPDIMEFYDPGTHCTAVYDLGQAEAKGLYQERYLETEDAYSYFLDGNHGVVQIETGQMGGGHLAVVKDSFANCLIPFLTRHYEKITIVDPRYFRTDIPEWLSEQNATEVLILAQDDVHCELTAVRP